MKPFREFHSMDASFWAFVKYISEMLGYTDRQLGGVKSYIEDEVREVCDKYSISVEDNIIQKALSYTKQRAEMLNQFAEPMLMDAHAAREEFKNWEQIHRAGNYFCKLPKNKQKGEMDQTAFFTSIINIIAEKTIREVAGVRDNSGFDDDPQRLIYIKDKSGRIIGASSRRFDGAFPSIDTPKLVWEIKEYYYATTFGSRVADGVYETQLDGFEFKELFERTGYKVYHVLFIDAYRTWWKQGKSYLCRLIDAMNSGVVDEVIVGREVLSRWPELLKEIMGDTVFGK